MINKTLFITLLVDALFLASGALQLGFSVIIKQRALHTVEPSILHDDQHSATLAQGHRLAQDLVYAHYPLVAAMVSGVLIMATFALTLPGLVLPQRKRWLQWSIYPIIACGLFTLALGCHLWLSTMHTRQRFYDIYVDQPPSVQDALQTTFKCCGYYNSSTPAFVTDSTCLSPAAAAMVNGCAGHISAYANDLTMTVFTTLFGMVGLDAVYLLCLACLLRSRREAERYKFIDSKRGYRQI